MELMELMVLIILIINIPILNHTNFFNPTEHMTGFSNGYTSGYDKGFNTGYLRAMEEYKKINNNEYAYYSNGYYYNTQSNDYTSGYDCGIRNYINAVNLINSYNPNGGHINNKFQSQNTKHCQTKKKFNKKTEHAKQSSIPKKQNKMKNNSLCSKSFENDKPFLIIKKITKDSANETSKETSTDDIGSIFTNLLRPEDNNLQKSKTDYLEDSDDENDNLVTIDELLCNNDFINNKKKEFDNIKIISLKEIIEKDNISSIDDLITIGNYYEKNFFTNEKSTTNNTTEDDDKKFESDNEEELRVMESIIKSLGIPITPTTNIIINNKTKKKVLSPSKNSISSNDTIPNVTNGEKISENTVELYKINDCYFTINLEKIFKMRGHLIKLKKMIGLKNIKSEIIDMILYYLMEFEKSNNNMLHMTLEGSPGCGKTKLAKIISKLLGAMGILDNDKVVYARRTDMIGQYLGQTGHKTQKVIDSALGGVLFIDEAYSLGNSKKDIYSKECIDILNQKLSDNKKKLVCIIAGYPEELENYFFSSNPGLTRRFPFRFKINNYTHTELLNIFINKINKLNWKLDVNTDLVNFFKINISHFKYFGGDIDTFIQDLKYSHSRRVVCSHPSEFKIITNTDINNAFDKFKNRRNNSNSDVWKGMFV